MHKAKHYQPKTQDELYKELISKKISFLEILVGIISIFLIALLLIFVYFIKIKPLYSRGPLTKYETNVKGLCLIESMVDE